MKNIEVILPNQQDNFLSVLWKTQEFQILFETHYFFQLLRGKLKESAVYFFEIENEKARNHLTSIFRCIAYREYANPYIQDLYYFHELCHCAQYEASENIDYNSWAEKLSLNEMYASLMSEVFIYFMDNSLLDKTFDNLWVRKFFSSGDKHKDINGFVLTNSQKDKFYQERVINKTWNPFDLNNIWPESIVNIIEERKKLREVVSTEGLDDASAMIVSYNNSHKLWVQKWQSHYLIIEEIIIKLLKKDITEIEYLNIVLANCDEYGRPFFPKIIK